MTGKTAVILQNLVAPPPAKNVARQKTSAADSAKQGKKDDVKGGGMDFAQVMDKKDTPKDAVTAKDTVTAANTKAAETENNKPVNAAVTDGTQRKDKIAEEESPGEYMDFAALFFGIQTNSVTAAPDISNDTADVPEPAAENTAEQVISEIPDIVSYAEMPRSGFTETVEAEIPDIAPAVNAMPETAAEPAAENEPVNPTEEVGETERFGAFIGRMNIDTSDIESVKYTGYKTVNMAAGAEAKANVENMLQSMVYAQNDMPEEYTDIPEQVAETEIAAAVTEAAAAVETADTETAAGAVEKVTAAAETDKTVGTDKSAETETVETDEVQVTEVKEVTAYTAKGGKEESSGESGSERNDSRDFAPAAVHRNRAGRTDNRHGHTYGAAGASNYRMYDINTRSNVSSQVANAVSRTVADTALLNAAQGTKQMVIQLNPESLGRIMIRLEAVGDKMSLKIISSNSEVRAMISAQLASITNAVKQHGVNLESAEVSNNPFGNDTEHGRHHGGRRGDEAPDKKREGDGTEYASFAERIDESMENTAV